MRLHFFETTGIQFLRSYINQERASHLFFLQMDQRIVSSFMEFTIMDSLLLARTTEESSKRLLFRSLLVKTWRDWSIYWSLGNVNINSFHRLYYFNEIQNFLPFPLSWYTWSFVIHRMHNVIIQCHKMNVHCKTSVPITKCQSPQLGKGQTWQLLKWFSKLYFWQVSLRWTHAMKTWNICYFLSIPFSFASPYQIK